MPEYPAPVLAGVGYSALEYEAEGESEREQLTLLRETEKVMAKYIVNASELVFYRFEVEANNQEEADEKALDYEVTNKDINDSDSFQIESVEKASK